MGGRASGRGGQAARQRTQKNGRDGVRWLFVCLLVGWYHANAYMQPKKDLAYISLDTYRRMRYIAIAERPSPSFKWNTQSLGGAEYECCTAW